MTVNKTATDSTKLTTVLLSIFAAVCVLQGATAGISIFTGGLLHVFILMFSVLLLLSFIGLFFAHLVFIFLSRRRMAHFIMVLLILVAFEIIEPLTGDWVVQGHRQWFFRTAMPAYQPVVERIMRDKMLLTNEDRLQSLVDHPAGCPRVSGWTNADGSVVIIFSGGDHWREGYLYYSGTQVVARPSYPKEVSPKRFILDSNPFELIIRSDDSNEYSIAGSSNYDGYYFHLTNGWYEY